MTWKQVDVCIIPGLMGALAGSFFNYIWGTLIGLVLGISVGTQTEEYKREKEKCQASRTTQKP